MIEELYLRTRLADLEREFDAHWRKNQLLAQLPKTVEARPCIPAAAAPMTYPWGEPGHEFVGRRRAWLHNLLAGASTKGASTAGES